MADRTRIEWCDASWSPLVGCLHVSRGCERCWAERQARRFSKMWPGATDIDGWIGHIVSAPDHIWMRPLHWRRSRRIFALGMTDFCYLQQDARQLRAVGKVIEATPQHTYILLTKRPESLLRAICKMFDCNRAPDHVWIGVSVEDQTTANDRVSALLGANVTVMPIVSCEPLLGSIDLANAAGVPLWNDLIAGIRWVIVGCESGAWRRPAKRDWFRSLRDQCRDADVPFFLKQLSIDGRVVKECPELDGIRHAEIPR